MKSLRTKIWYVQEDKSYNFPGEEHQKNIMALSYCPVSGTGNDVELVVAAGLVAARIQLFSSQNVAKRKTAYTVQKGNLPNDPSKKGSSKEKKADRNFSSQTSAKKKTTNSIQKSLPNDPPKKDTSAEKATDKNCEV